MSEQQPPEQTPAGDVPAAIEPDAPTEAQPSGDASAATVVDQPSPVTQVAPVPEPPPAIVPAIEGTAPDSPAPVPPSEPGPAVESSEPGPAVESSEPGPAALAALAADRPEVAIGAAFAGGLVLALILKRLAR